MSARPSSTELRSSRRIVIRSPPAVGAVATRMSTSLPAILRPIRPSCAAPCRGLRGAVILRRVALADFGKALALKPQCPLTRLIDARPLADVLVPDKSGDNLRYRDEALEALVQLLRDEGSFVEA